MKKIVLMGLILLMAFSGATAPAEEEKVLTVGTTTKVSGQFFTSLFGNNTSDIDVRAMIHGYQPTYWDNQVNFAMDKAAVESIRINQQSKFTRYTVTLQPDLLYSDGKTHVTAKDYVFSMLLMTSPQMAEIGANAGRYAYVYGYDDWHAGKAEALSGLHLDGELVFSVDVKKEFLPYFYEMSYLHFLPYPIGVIAPGCRVTETEKGAAIVNEEAGEPLFTAELLQKTVLDSETGYMAHPALTTGPYVLTAYDAEKGEVQFKKNPYYKGNHAGTKPGIENISLVPVYRDTMAEDLKAGRVDVINKLSNGGIIDGLLADGVRHAAYPRLGYAYIAFKMDKGSPFAAANARRALAFALDKEKFTSDFTHGYGETVYGYYGIGQWEVLAAKGLIMPSQMGIAAMGWGLRPLKALDLYPYNIAKAVQMLEKDGWRLNAEGRHFKEGKDTLRYRKGENGLEAFSVTFAMSRNNDASEMMREQLKQAAQALSIDIKVAEVPFTELLADHYRPTEQKKYDLSLLATNFLASFDPCTSFHTDASYLGSVNTSGYQDRQLQYYALDMHKTRPMDLMGYLKKWQTFQARYADRLPTLPLYSNDYYDFFTPALQNYHPESHENWPSAILEATLER